MGLQSFYRKGPLRAPWLSHRVLVSKETSFFYRVLKIDCLYPFDGDKMLVVSFVECLRCLKLEFCNGSGGALLINFEFIVGYGSFQNFPYSDVPFTRYRYPYTVSGLKSS